MRGRSAYALAAAAATIAAVSLVVAQGRAGVAAGSTVTITAAGDICGKNRPSTCAGTGDLVRTLDPTLALTLGDNQYRSGTFQEYRRSYDLAWGSFEPATRPAPGNHEWGSGLAGYKSYFGTRVLTAGHAWYSFDLGEWHLVSLDGTCSRSGGCGPGSPQYAFLQADLAQDQHGCTLAYWHQPLFSSGTTHGGTASVKPLWSLLFADGAELVLNGHEHNYERFRPQTPAGQADVAGITELVVGTGGVSSYPFGSPEPNSVTRITGTKGVTEVTLSPGGWSSRFIADGAVVIDAASGTCH